MKINPDDPWFPAPIECETEGVTIRLKLAAMAMQGWLASRSEPEIYAATTWPMMARAAFEAADAMIERANRESDE